MAMVNDPNPSSSPNAPPLASQSENFLDRRTMRWAVTLGASVMALIGVVLLYLLTVSSSNRDLYEVSYTRLFALNIAVAVGLVALIAWFVLRLAVRLKQRKFGSQLLIKLALIFGLVGILPGLLIYVVSYQFVSRSIESWFDIKVENALAAGLSLGRSTLDVLTTDLSNKTRKVVTVLSDQSDVSAALSIDRLKDQMGVDEVALWSGAGQLIASSNNSQFSLTPPRPTAQLLRNLKAQKLIATVEDFEEASNDKARSRAYLKVLAVVSNAGFAITDEPRVLQVIQTLSPALVTNANEVALANSEYHERALAREGLRRMYIGTLTLALFLAVLGAVLLAMLLGSQLAQPLLVLAEGMQQVAQGDLQPKQALQGTDELDGLTRSFAAMTQQIREAQVAQVQSSREINQEREKLQTILDNLSAGVLVMAPDGQVLSANPAAATILREDLHTLVGGRLDLLVAHAELAHTVAQQFASYESNARAGRTGYWQAPVTLQWGHAQSGEIANRHEVHLIVRGAVLPSAAALRLKLVVFDDITDVVSAQRSLAWGEVARRLAHEIKNPLTPIQLSAQRLERRLSGKLADTDEAVLRKSVNTIVSQVDAMKNLVNEFREYARLPVAQLVAQDLNALVQEICHIYDEEQAVSKGDGSEPRPGIQLQLDPQCPPVALDAGQLRQVLHNLLQNAQDASGHDVLATISVATQWHQANGQVRLSVLDSGPGFADNVLARAAEPYVTTKASGTGLGLAVVKKIAEEHFAKLEVSNRVRQGEIIGAQVSLVFFVSTPASVAGHQGVLPDAEPTGQVDS